MVEEANEVTARVRPGSSPPLALVRQPSWDEALPLVQVPKHNCAVSPLGLEALSRANHDGPLHQDEPPPVADPDDSAGVDAGDHVLPLPSLPDLSHCCLSALLPPLQADVNSRSSSLCLQAMDRYTMSEMVTMVPQVRSPLQRAPVRKKLLGAPRQLEAGVHGLAQHQELLGPLLLGRLPLVRRGQHRLVRVGHQLLEL